ncbi:MAG: porin [Paracoccaceae bacterium]
MKKILLATTMLAGTAGFASAEVAITGYAEMGIWSDTAGDLSFWNDIDVTFAMTSTTDGGLEFGATVDLDEAAGLVATSFNGTSVYISGAFGKLTMGDTDGAIDWAIEDSGTLTSLNDDHTSHIAQFSWDQGLDGEGDGQIVRYENTFGAFSFAISAEQEDDGAAGGADDIWGIGVKYAADLGGTTLNLGLAYMTGNEDAKFLDGGGLNLAALPALDDANVDVWAVSVGAELAGGFSGMIGFEDFSYEAAARNDYTFTSLGLNYTTGALSMNLNYGVMAPEVGADFDSWGAAVNYDLGGGAVVMVGYGSDMDGLGNDTWSAGLGMTF